jgi:hypothetical protein
MVSQTAIGTGPGDGFARNQCQFTPPSRRRLRWGPILRQVQQQRASFEEDQSSSPSSPGCARGSARSRRGASDPVMAGSPGRRTP